jgi:phosphoribosylamine---glycine ligase
MRVLIIDATGNALDFAMRAQKDGHQVKMFIRYTEKSRYVGRGLVTLVDDYKGWLRWADLVFASDNTLYLQSLDAFRKEGTNAAVIAASQEAGEWELNRERGQEVLKKHGVSTIPFKMFSDYDDAIRYVKKEDKRFVSKAAGGVEDKSLSYVSKTPEDLVYMLGRWKKLSKHKTQFMLQEFIPGTEMAVGGWYGPGGFNEGWCENFEFKKLMNKDLGVATGEQGTVLRYTKQSKLARKVLQPVERALEKLNYIGYIDINCIIDEKGRPWPLEFTMRPGWPTFNIQQAVHTGDSVQWLMDLAKGVDPRNTLLDRVAAGVVMSIPDYPYSHLTRKEVVGVPIYNAKPSLWQHIHPCEMMLGEKVPTKVGNSIVDIPSPVTAGDYVLIMSAAADTVKDAVMTCYRRLNRLVVPNSPMYRTDIGQRLATQLPAIQKMGYATGMAYSLTS